MSRSFPWTFCLVVSLAVAGGAEGADMRVDVDIEVPMRDGVVLRADLYRPAAGERFPVLVYRTPYGKHSTVEAYDTHRSAVERGYAVVIQDVRGRYASEGEFYPYVNEGNDGFDTIEWAAQQPWSTGEVGTFGLSYPGAVQWLAALERPPHLKAMVPAMTFSTPRRFFYFNGVFDLSWIPWIYNSIAPDIRARHDLPGPRTDAAAEDVWRERGLEMRRHLPLLDLEELADVAPFYYDWLRHPPEDPWWDWAELTGRYALVDAAVLNLSGWYDEAYGPDGATTNYQGLVAARSEQPDPRAQLVLGPWVHGVNRLAESQVGDIDFGSEAALDYDDLVLRWMDHYVRGIDNGVDREAPVRFFLMGANRWRHVSTWPPPQVVPTNLYLVATSGPGTAGALQWDEPSAHTSTTTFLSDPSDPVTDPYPVFGPHDYSSLEQRRDLLIFDSAPLPSDLTVVGAIEAEIFVSCDCPDFDLWVKVLDVSPTGGAVNLMSPGSDVLRASYRETNANRQLLEPGTIYKLRLPHMLTGNVFGKDHRIRVQISGAFFPHFSRNLQTGESEAGSSSIESARITVHHDSEHPSRIRLPVLDNGNLHDRVGTNATMEVEDRAARGAAAPPRR